MVARPRQTPKDQPIYPIYVIHGKDRRMIIDKLDEVLDEVLQDCDRQVSLSTYDGDLVLLPEVLDGLRTMPFLSPRRVIVIKDADDFISEHRRNLEKYLENPSPTGVLVLIAQSFPKTTRLTKRALSIGMVHSYDSVKPRALPGYVANYARKKYNLRLNNPTAELLVQLAGEDTGLLCGEVDKLATYVSDPKNKRTEITSEDVEALVGHNRHYSVFNVIDAMTVGDASQALNQLDTMLRQDRDAQFKSVGAFAWHFRRLYQAKLLQQQGVRNSDITKNLRIWPHPEAFIKQVNLLKIKEIGDCLQKLTKIDHAAKTGAGTVKGGLEKMIVHFCHSTKPKSL